MGALNILKTKGFLINPDEIQHEAKSEFAVLKGSRAKL
jgi:hypothetical protein